jgi:hypothetical protein
VRDGVDDEKFDGELLWVQFKPEILDRGKLDWPSVGSAPKSITSCLTALWSWDSLKS